MTAVDDFDYALPRELIAQEPAERRDASHAIFVERQREPGVLGVFAELVDHLCGDECLVVNDTRVIPARLRARRDTGGQVEVFLLRPVADGVWHAWLSPSRRVRPGESLTCRGERLEVLERSGSFWHVRVGDEALVEALGEVPIPPYIVRDSHDPRLHGLDKERYQTIFAREPGAVAAPTAGLHFSDALLTRLAERSIPVVPVTLHVGPGTFLPMSCQHVEDHQVDPELYRISAESRARLATACKEGRRIVAVGTTSLRLLESLDTLDEGPELRSETSLTVKPGHRFRHVDGLITNFHLPRSSLLVLVSAFHGLEQTRAIYRRAVETRLRFYSYGDAMVILPEPRRC